MAGRAPGCCRGVVPPSPGPRPSYLDCVGLIVLFASVLTPGPLAPAPLVSFEPIAVLLAPAGVAGYPGRSRGVLAPAAPAPSRELAAPDGGPLAVCGTLFTGVLVRSLRGPDAAAPPTGFTFRRLSPSFCMPFNAAWST